MKYATKILHNGNERDPHTGALSIPIYQVSTFHQDDIEHPGRYDYSRSNNPTREALENTLAALEGGTRGFAFASGMAAVSSALALFSHGDHIIATEDIYGGSYRILTKFFNKFGLEVTFVDMTDLNQVEKAIRKNTKALFLESPSNPLLKITDIAGAVELAKRYNLLTLIDNTFMSPYFQRPLELGVDLVIHSATKFLGGHSDVIGGAVVVGSEALATKIYFVQNSFGAVQGPQDAWLVLRGIKTLRARMELQQQSAMAIARWLQGEDWVEKVYYPGLPEHPGHELIKVQASGFGAVVSFKTDTPERALRIMRNVRLWSVAVSLGGVESILSYPARMSHAALPKAERERLGLTDNFIRLSVGLEDAEDLMADLEASRK
ncbi:MAG TPA: aminotransferase class I/II-fold pyridoxal phosphate-dependent enzyme [Firmicutes bacterium]|jgi:cystathionine beta-lyase|nr:aminotransferase class I/II-fold pyridoxal phosphate-dependent enzyme [Bacillota bacterium]HOQ24420.1 aminotransferase class I/II-fold pyridoxal phosphate-dependent enzyme [Bacillota bacterium]HPT68491.1 aminotransferase class I/II-fold pyridoxal phosphate-dependent enzyme [Bacillota bacterium]